MTPAKKAVVKTPAKKTHAHDPEPGAFHPGRPSALAVKSKLPVRLDEMHIHVDGGAAGRGAPATFR